VNTNRIILTLTNISSRATRQQIFVKATDILEIEPKILQHQEKTKDVPTEEGLPSAT
jgi:hypothetical protein